MLRSDTLHGVVCRTGLFNSLNMKQAIKDSATPRHLERSEGIPARSQCSQGVREVLSVVVVIICMKILKLVRSA